MTSSDVPSYLSRTPPPIDDEDTEGDGVGGNISNFGLGGGMKILDLESTPSRESSPAKPLHVLQTSESSADIPVKTDFDAVIEAIVANGDVNGDIIISENETDSEVSSICNMNNNEKRTKSYTEGCGEIPSSSREHDNEQKSFSSKTETDMNNHKADVKTVGIPVDPNWTMPNTDSSTSLKDSETAGECVNEAFAPPENSSPSDNQYCDVVGFEKESGLDSDVSNDTSEAHKSQNTGIILSQDTASPVPKMPVTEETDDFGDFEGFGDFADAASVPTSAVFQSSQETSQMIPDLEFSVRKSDSDDKSADDISTDDAVYCESESTSFNPVFDTPDLSHQVESDPNSSSNWGADWSAFGDGGGETAHKTDVVDPNSAADNDSKFGDDGWANFASTDAPSVSDSQGLTTDQPDLTFSEEELEDSESQFQSKSDTDANDPLSKEVEVLSATIIYDKETEIQSSLAPSLGVMLNDQSVLCWYSSFSIGDVPPSPCVDVRSSGKEGEVMGDKFLWSLLSEETWDVAPSSPHHSHDVSADSCSRLTTLWNELRTIEETRGIRYQWLDPPSEVYQSFLVSLNMNINLAKMRVLDPKRPAHAAHLGTVKLTPQFTPLVPTVSSQNMHQSGGGGRPVTARVTSSAGDSIPSSASSSPGPPEPRKKPIVGADDTGVDSLSVPPVDFDWSDVDLVNPLRSATATSTIMDLDFLSTNELVNSKSALESDLAKLGLNVETEFPDSGGFSRGGSHNSSVGSKSVNLLETLMKQQQQQTSQILSPTSLSEEAKKLKDSLPNLGFMLSPVLMFPIKEQQPSPQQQQQHQ